MAEHVQAALDQMVAPLRDLMDRNIFSEEETKAIVARRRESEYLLRRLTARKADFLRYIEAEQGLEKLRQLRTVQRKRDHRKTVNVDGTIQKEKQHIGDVHIVKHVHLLFVRALRKFRADLSMHLLHADFCKEQKSWNRLGKVYTEALQVFPRRTGLWIEAAGHEFFGPNRNVRNARILLQRALRFHATSEDLWMEYFSLELHYVQTLKGRRQILQGQEELATDESDEDYYKIAGIVYKNAIKAVPESIPFRLRFLDTCRRFPSTESLMASIQEPLQKDFASQPEAWIARALYEAEKQSNSDTTTKMEQSASEVKESGDESYENERPSKKARMKDPVVVVLEIAIESIPSDDMYLQAFRFAQTYKEEMDQKGKEEQKNQVQKFVNELLKKSSNHSSSDLALEQSDYFVSIGQEQKAIQTLKEFCTSQKSAPASLWTRWAGMSPKSATSIFEKALLRIDMGRSDHMNVLLQYFGSLMARKEENKQHLFDIFQRILLLAPSASELIVEDVSDLPFGVESVSQACFKYLEYAYETYGLTSARKVYSSVLFQSSLEVNESNVEYVKALVDKCTQMESKDKVILRRLYDKAVELFKDTSLEEVYREQRNDRAIYQ
jgi:U3 small nucleolar RNA-associated protein 6